MMMMEATHAILINLSTCKLNWVIWFEKHEPIGLTQEFVKSNLENFTLWTIIAGDTSETSRIQLFLNSPCNEKSNNFLVPYCF